MPVSVDRFHGHIAFGSLQMGLATWWTICILRRYYQQLSKNKPFYSTTWYPTKCCSRLPVEPILKVVIGSCTGGIMWYDFIKSLQLGDGMAPTAGPHAVGAAVYILLPIVEVLQFYKFTAVGLFENIAFAMHVVALWAATIVFSFHTHGRLVVDTHIHKLLGITFALMLITVILDYRCRNSVVVSLSKCYFYMLCGCWAFSAAFMLGSQVDWIPALDLQKMENVTLVTCLYVFLMAVVCVYMFVVVSIVGRPYTHLVRESLAKSTENTSNRITNGTACKTV